MPVGMWRRRKADSRRLRCCPPGPDARKVVTSHSDSRRSLASGVTRRLLPHHGPETRGGQEIRTHPAPVNLSPMHILELWRYPVKSMAGEPLQEADLLEDGIAGDRLLHVRGPNGRVVTSRNRPRLLGHKAVLGPAGQPLVDGLPWDAPEVGARVEAAAGAGARLYRSDDGKGRRFDVLPLLVAT